MYAIGHALFVLAATAKTPRGVAGMLNTAIAKSAQSQEVAAALATQGTDTAIMTPGQSAAYVRLSLIHI